MLPLAYMRTRGRDDTTVERTPLTSRSRRRALTSSRRRQLAHNVARTASSASQGLNQYQYLVCSIQYSVFSIHIVFIRQKAALKGRLTNRLMRAPRTEPS